MTRTPAGNSGLAKVTSPGRSRSHRQCERSENEMLIEKVTGINYQKAKSH